MTDDNPRCPVHPEHYDGECDACFADDYPTYEDPDLDTEALED